MQAREETSEMSATITTASAAVNQATGVASLRTTMETAARNGANDLPSVVQAVAPFYPGLPEFLAGQSALGSKTFIFPVVAHALVWAVGYFGLSWDAAFTESVAGVISMGLMALGRWVATGPITSVLPKKGVLPGAPPVAGA